MAQYYPAYRSHEINELNRCLHIEEYQEVKKYFFALGFRNGFWQSLEAASQEYMPNFL